MSANATTAAPRAAAWRLDLPISSHPVESAIIPDDGRTIKGESIIGQDQRVLVDMADIQDGGKYRSVVKIQSRFEDARTGEEVWMMGSGWLIRPDLLVTAGHVVYDWGRRLGAATQLKCYIGYNGRDSLQSAQTQARYGLNVVSTAEWIESPENRRHDVAFIQVDRAFTGNLRTFNFVNTPNPATRVNLGVVGYPGDKILMDVNGEENGAQMYEQFAFLNYDLSKSPRNMVEYKVSTYGGQSGGPILRRIDGKLVAIGTHCYGGGGDDSNSGNSIMGRYGNNYEAFVRLFNADQSPFNTTKVQLVDTQNGSIQNGSTQNNNTTFNPTGFTRVAGSGSPSTSLPIIQAGQGGQEEGLLDILKVVAGIGSTVLPIASSMLGPVGTIVGTAAGGILGSFAQSESCIDIDNNGAAERAVVAEAALQAVLSMEHSPESEEVISKMEQIWSKNNTNIDGVVKAVAPALAECALDFAPIAQKIQGTECFILREPQHLKIQLTEGAGDNAFIEGIFGPTRPIAGAEGFGDFLGPLLKKAVGIAGPIVGQLATAGINTAANAIGGLFESAYEQPTFSRNEEATRLLLKRAMVADTALQALMTLPKNKLQRLTLAPGTFPVQGEGAGQTENVVFDFIKTKVQEYGPTVLSGIKTVAKDVARKYLPSLINAGAKKLDSTLSSTLGLNQESAAAATPSGLAPGGTLNKKPSLMELLSKSTNGLQVVA